MIITKSEMITPQLAREYLRTNSNNRPLRVMHVTKLADAFARGEYAQTHQGIAFDSAGVLLDGQHRLHAIERQQDGFSVAMLVTRGLDRATTFLAVDANHAVRSNADVLGKPRHLVQVAQHLAVIAAGYNGKITPNIVAPMFDFIVDDLTELLTGHLSTPKSFGSAAARAAAVACMKMHDRPFAIRAYRSGIKVYEDALSMADDMPSSVFGLSKRFKNRKLTPPEVFIGCYKAFNKAFENHKLIRHTEIEDQTIPVRDFLIDKVYGGKRFALRMEK